MRDLLVRMATPDIQAIHTALADEFLAAGHQRDFLFSPTPLPGGGFGAWVRINDPAETRGREVSVPPVGAESDFILRAFAAGKLEGKKRAYPVAPEFDDARMQWLARRGAANGFATTRVYCNVEGATIHRPQGTFGFNVTVYSGRLRVTDADSFQAALRNGIGTRRGYGCGMLILLPDHGMDVQTGQPTNPHLNQRSIL